jgi:hypothetical protein
MNQIEFISYFEKIASTHKLINHQPKVNERFIVWPQGDLVNKFSKMKDAFMVLNEGSGAFEKLGEGYIDVKRVSFEIHCQYKSSQDATDKIRASDQAEQIAKNIIARMIEESEDYDDGVCPRFMRQFRAETVIYENFESMAPNFVTCLCSFSIQDDNYLENDLTVWQ